MIKLALQANTSHLTKLGDSDGDPVMRVRSDNELDEDEIEARVVPALVTSHLRSPSRSLLSAYSPHLLALTSWTSPPQAALEAEMAQPEPEASARPTLSHEERILRAMVCRSFAFDVNPNTD